MIAPRREPPPLDALLDHFAAATEAALSAVSAGDAAAVGEAIDRRETLIPALTRALAGLAAVDAAHAPTLQRLVHLQARQAELDFALGASRDDLAQQIERLDEVHARSGRYRGDEEQRGNQLDLRS